ncbi:hypothetical protein ACQPWW_13655 [Micromonospora sp. CA-240977]|uniref:hypothetical protein n=1 Tax=Micromonospora sp. CA-240977 TaxID=3239957 RepID=UPI003D8ED1CE
MEAVGLQPGETVASYGRTIYPGIDDPHRRRVVELRERRTFAERLADTRRASILPEGRAQHVVERFPPTRGLPGSRVGPLYHGEGRQELLSMLYLAVTVESPGLVPEVGDLAWIAEMGEETALDMACAELDRQARSLLERDPADLWPLLERSLRSSRNGADWRLRQIATRLAPLAQTMWAPGEGADGEPYVDEPPFNGVRQILDAVLMIADDGHAPGTRVRVLASSHEGRVATIVEAVWGAPAPPVAYHVQIDGSATTLTVRTDELIVLAGQESLPR